MHPAAAVVLDTFAKRVDDVRATMEAHPQDWYLIRDLGTGWHLVGKQDLSAVLGRSGGSQKFGDVFPHCPVPFVHPDLPLDLPLRKLGGFPFLPVVNRADPSQLVGLITRDDVLNTYARADEAHMELAGPS